MANIMGMRILTPTNSDSMSSRYAAVERRRVHQETCFLYMENALTGVCITQDEKILICNQRFAEMFGFSRDDLNGMKLSELFDSDLRQQTAADTRAAAEGAEMSSIQEVTGFAKDGRTVCTIQTVDPLRYEDKLLAIRHVVDVTEQKFVEDTLRDSERDLRVVSEQVLKAQETERKRVASELHDGLGQTLSSIKFSLENTFYELYDALPADALLKLAGTVSSVQGAIDEVRRISMDLRPAMLDDLGIEPTITWLCREFQVAHPSIKIIKHIDLRQTDIGSTLTVVIFRILQEALNNIAKHADATQIKVSLGSHAREIKLSVEDNGCGFILERSGEAHAGFGLYSMRERAALSGGHLALESVTGAGTRVNVTWPRGRASASDMTSGTYDKHSPTSTATRNLEG